MSDDGKACNGSFLAVCRCAVAEGGISDTLNRFGYLDGFQSRIHKRVLTDIIEIFRQSYFGERLAVVESSAVDTVKCIREFYFRERAASTESE